MRAYSKVNGATHRVATGCCHAHLVDCADSPYRFLTMMRYGLHDSSNAHRDTLVPSAPSLKRCKPAPQALVSASEKLGDTSGQPPMLLDEPS